MALRFTRLKEMGGGGARTCRLPSRSRPALSCIRIYTRIRSRVRAAAARTVATWLGGGGNKVRQRGRPVPYPPNRRWTVGGKTRFTCILIANARRRRDARARSYSFNLRPLPSLSRAPSPPVPYRTYRPDAHVFAAPTPPFPDSGPHVSVFSTRNCHSIKL